MVEMDIIYTRKATPRFPFKRMETNYLSKLVRHVTQKTQALHHRGLPGLLSRCLSNIQKLHTHSKLLFTKGCSTKVCRLRDRHLHKNNSVYLGSNRKDYVNTISPLIDVLLDNNSVFYDVGSGWGYFSAMAATRQNFEGKIIAFEQSADNYSDLQQFLEEAELNHFISAYHVKLTNHISSQVLSSQIPNELPPEHIRLDNIEAPNPDMIKIAFSGMEEDIIASGVEKIERSSPFILFKHALNDHTSKNPLKVFELLDNLDYVFFNVRWMDKDNALVPSNHYSHAPSSRDISLIPMTKHERRFKDNIINVLACPLSKLHKLDQSFHSIQRRESYQWHKI